MTVKSDDIYALINKYIDTMASQGTKPSRVYITKAQHRELEKVHKKTSPDVPFNPVVRGAKLVIAED